MAEIKGKFITLTCMLMQGNPEALTKADEYLEEETGCTHDELDPEEFYDVKYWDKTMGMYSSTFDDPKEAIINLGKRVYPTIKRTSGFPDDLKTPMDFVHFETQNFLVDHQGDDVVPRKIINEGENEITLYAPAPGYDENLYIGVWLGILEIVGITSGQVEEQGNHTYRIYW